MNDKMHVLIPAAGSSSRLGTNKQLVDLGGEPLLRRAVGRVLAAGFTEITVVTGFEPEAAASAVQGLGCHLEHNAEWEMGLGSSLARGITSIPSGAAAVLVVLPDQFQVPASHLARLAKQHELAPANLVASRYGDVIGVPAIFPARLFDALAGLSGQPGARVLFHQFRSETLVLDCPEAALDLDTPADLAVLDSRVGFHAHRDLSIQGVASGSNTKIL